MRSRAGRVIAAALVSLGFLLLVVGAAVRGTLPAPPISAGDATAVPGPIPTTGVADPIDLGWLSELGKRGGSDWSAFDIVWIGLALGIVALVATTTLLVQPARRFLRITAKPTGEIETTATEEDEVDEEPNLPALVRGVDAATASLRAHAAPSDAVIAAWVELEEAAAQSGLVRRPAQTASEFTVAVLTRTRADERATRELLELYHRARFSTHPPGPAEVDAATECLSRIAASWPEGVAAGQR